MSLNLRDVDEDMIMQDVTAHTKDTTTSDAGAISTSGLFKKTKKRSGLNVTSTTAADSSTTASTTRIRSTMPHIASGTTRLSFDDAEESSLEAAASGVDLLAIQLREEKEKRKKAKKLAKSQQEGDGRRKDEIIPPTINASTPSSASYTPEALAELRRNARSYSALPPPSTTASSHKGVDAADLDDEINLAALPSSSTITPLGLTFAPAISSSFRPSGRAKQLALQEADDLRRDMAARARAGGGGGISKTQAIVLDDDEDGGDGASAATPESRRERELEKLAEERMIRAAKLKRGRMRQAMADEDGSTSQNYIPLNNASKSMQLRDGSQVANVEFDKQYGVAVRDEDDDDDEANTILRQDADDVQTNIYDDDGQTQGEAVGDRLRFGDPAARDRQQEKRQQIGALLNQSSGAGKKQRNQAIRQALQTDKLSSKAAAIDLDDDDDDLEGGMEVDDDDETRAWEEEVMRKGGAKPDVAAAAAAKVPPKGVRASTVINTSSNDARSSLAEQIESSMASASAASGTATSLIEPVDLFYAALNTQLSSMRTSYDTLNARYHKLEQTMLAEEKVQHELQQRLDAKNDSYIYYQELSHHIITGLDCLSDKSRDIDAAWSELNEMKRVRQQEIVNRIQEHETDLWKECFPQAEDGDTQMQTVPQVDEFGRDIGFVHDAEKLRRKEVRLEWFNQQVAAIKSTMQSPSSTPSTAYPIGWESLQSLVTSDIELGSTRFNEAVASLIQDTHHIFSDTNSEYHTLDGMKAWMEEWKGRERTTYEQAYIPFSMPIILAPYIKLELIQRWNLLSQPHFSEELKTNSPDNYVSWYKKLFDYGMNVPPPATNSAPADSVDDDSHLLPKLIETILIPIVTNFITNEFDVFSSAHITALKSCLDDIEVHLLDPTTSANLQTLRTTLMQVYQTHISAHHKTFNHVPTVDSTPAIASSIAFQNQVAYCTYHWYRGLHLFHSLVQFHSVLTSSEVKQLASQHLIQSLLPYLAWKCVQVDQYAATQHQPTLLKPLTDAEPSSLLLIHRTLASTPLDEWLSMIQHFLRCFPRDWISATSNQSSSSSMTQLVQLLTQIQQQTQTPADKKLLSAEVQANLKQLRALLKK